MPFSAATLTSRLAERPLVGRFEAGPLLLHVYKEDPRRLVPMVDIEDDEDPSAAGGDLVALLTVIWLAPSIKNPEPEMLYYYQGWASPIQPGLGLYESTLLDLQLMLRTMDDSKPVIGYDDYTVAGMLFLHSKMGQELAAQVKVMQIKPGGGGELFRELPR